MQVIYTWFTHALFAIDCSERDPFRHHKRHGRYTSSSGCHGLGHRLARSEVQPLAARPTRLSVRRTRKSWVHEYCCVSILIFFFDISSAMILCAPSPLILYSTHTYLPHHKAPPFLVILNRAGKFLDRLDLLAARQHALTNTATPDDHSCSARASQCEQGGNPIGKCS